jgi:small subunit ribosomal protein S8
MLTKIRNALAAGHKKVTVVYSRFNLGICKVLQQEGYIADVVVIDFIKGIELTLKYFKGQPTISLIKRISKPGCRKYCQFASLPVVCRGMGIAILSTSLGIISNKEARAKNMGGEIICYVV